MRNGKSMTHASSAGGGAGTHVGTKGKTSVRSTLQPAFGKRGSKRSGGGRRSGRR